MDLWMRRGDQEESGMRGCNGTRGRTAEGRSGRTKWNSATERCGTAKNKRCLQENKVAFGKLIYGDTRNTVILKCCNFVANYNTDLFIIPLLVNIKSTVNSSIHRRLFEVLFCTSEQHQPVFGFSLQVPVHLTKNCNSVHKGLNEISKLAAYATKFKSSPTKHLTDAKRICHPMFHVSK